MKIFRVTSSEKVDKIQRYSDFVLCSVPYPGNVSILQLLILFLSSYQTYSIHTFCKALLPYLYPFSPHLLLCRSGSFVARQEMILSTNLRNVRVSVLRMFVLGKFEFVSNPILSSSVHCHFFLVSLSKCSGCEFFRDFKDNEYIADGLHFNWQQVNFTDVIGIRSHVLTFCQRWFAFTLILYHSLLFIENISPFLIG